MENTKLVSGEIQHSSSKTRKCERLGLTNAKGPNQEIQISAGTNPISSKANQSKLCEGSRSVICHMLHVTCIYWIITLTEKMMVHNHFDDQIMSKLSIRSTVGVIQSCHTLRSLFLGRFWTKIQSDNCFETISTPGLLLEGSFSCPLSLFFCL